MNEDRPLNSVENGVWALAFGITRRTHASLFQAPVRPEGWQDQPNHPGVAEAIRAAVQIATSQLTALRCTTVPAGELKTMENE